MRKSIIISLLLLFVVAHPNAQTLLSSSTNDLFYTDPEPTKIGSPKVLPPVSLEDSEGLLFKWERPKVASEAKVEYDFRLFYKEKEVYSITTTELELRYDATMPTLNPNADYRVFIHARVSETARSFLLSGDATSLDFRYIPTCTPPKNVQSYQKSAGSLLVSWEGKAPVEKSVEYQVRYRASNGDDWKELSVFKGNEMLLENLVKNVDYQVEVAKVCYWVDGSVVLSDWVGSAIAQPDFVGDCEFATYSYANPPNCTSLISDINHVFPPTIYIGGFQLLLDANPTGTPIVSEPGVNWSGSGTISLPLGENKKVKVEFLKVLIKTDNKICSGTVKGISDIPANIPSYTGNLLFGGEICLPPPTGNTINKLDEHGFDSSGVYRIVPPYVGWVPGMPYDTSGHFDPNGFDANGNYLNTGLPTNPNGCMQDSTDAAGQPCVPGPPYNWMNNGVLTDAGLQYWNQHESTVRDAILSVLNELTTLTQDSIDHKALECDDIRVTMTPLLSAAGLTEDFIYGVNGAYFEEGMSKNFKSAPQSAPFFFDAVTRSPAVVGLEIKHVLLYQCDVQLGKIKQLDSVLLAMTSVTGLSFITGIIKLLIQQQPKIQIDSFLNHPDYFADWLDLQIRLSVDSKYKSQFGSYGYFENKTDDSFQSKNYLTIKQTYADVANLNNRVIDGTEYRLEDAVFEYLQGFQIINGVSRTMVIDAIAEKRRVSGSLTSANPDLMPIELANIGSDGTTYRIYLDNIKFYPSSAAKADIHAVVTMPFSGQKIAFISVGFEFTPNGFALNADLKLQLETPVSLRLSNVAKLNLMAGPNTYMLMNCQGFNGLGVEADVEICRSIVIPYDVVLDKIKPEPARVKGHFITTMPSFSDIYIQLSIDPFVIKGYEDIKWRADNLVLDMSETISPLTVPPLGYETNFANALGFKNNWRGFHAELIQVTLPPKFSKDSTPVSLGVSNLIIDDTGVSCIVSVTNANILPLSRGSAGGWAFSIDDFKLKIIKNQLTEAGFAGLVHIPIMRGESNNNGTLAVSDCMKYSAIISTDNDYHFTVTQPIGAKYAVDMWKAGTLNLINSSILIIYKNGDFTTTATLNGNIVVDGDLAPGTNLPLKMPKLTFQNVVVMNKPPYLMSGTWGFPDSIGGKLVGFGLTLKNVSVSNDSSGAPALSFNAAIHVSADSTIDLKAGGGFRISGKLIDDNGRQRWIYKGFEVDELFIHGSFPGVRLLDGHIKFFKNDITYGTGFHGGLTLTLSGLETSVSVVGQFGRVSGYKYFMLDALVCGLKLPVFTGLYVTGLGGGIAYNMSRPAAVSGLPAGCLGVQSIPTAIGASLSGVIYKPVKDMASFKFTVAITAGSERALSVNATFEMGVSTANWSVKYMAFNGNARMMAPVDIHAAPLKNVTGASAQGAFFANLDCSYDFNSNIFDATLDVYANIGGVLKGAENGKVGQAKLYFSPNTWYLKVGRPDGAGSPIGIVLTIPGIGDLVKSTAYFQIGKNLDPLPALPANIAALTGLSRQSVSDSENGFIFGASLKLGNTFSFKPLHAKLEFIGGFDVAITEHPDAQCAGSTGAIGINGWRANGQIYASIECSASIKVKVFGKRKSFTIASFTAAAALQAGLPNPIFAQGAIAVDYKLCNGLVKGSANLSFQIGENCVIIGEDDPGLSLPIIASTTPANNQSSVSVGKNLEVAFNFPINKTFSYDDGDGVSMDFFIKLDSARLMWRGKYQMPVTLNWSDNNELLTIKSNVFLPEKDTFTLFIKVSVDSNGVATESQTRSVIFTTGPSLSSIPTYNIGSAYPYDGQYNFYRKEVEKGFVQLNRGQPDLFFDKPQSDLFVRFRRNDGGCFFQPLEISSDNLWNSKIEFDLPMAFLQHDKLFELQIIDFPKPIPNVGASTSGVNPCDCTGCIPAFVPTPPVTGVGAILAIPAAGRINDNAPPPANNAPVVIPVPLKILYSAYFRVSQFDRALDKFEAIQTSFPLLNNAVAEHAPIYSEEIRRTFPLNIEPFDKTELEGLVVVEIESAPSPAGTNLKHWSLGMSELLQITYFNSFGVGNIPIKCWNMFEGNYSLKVTKEFFNAGIPPALLSTPNKINFNVIDEIVPRAISYGQDIDASIAIDRLHWSDDPCDLANGITALQLKRLGKYGSYCNEGFSIHIDPPYYFPVKFTYQLPGSGTPTSTKVVVFK